MHCHRTRALGDDRYARYLRTTPILGRRIVSDVATESMEKQGRYPDFECTDQKVDNLVTFGLKDVGFLTKPMIERIFPLEPIRSLFSAMAILARAFVGSLKFHIDQQQHLLTVIRSRAIVLVINILRGNVSQSFQRGDTGIDVTVRIRKSGINPLRFHQTIIRSRASEDFRGKLKISRQT